MDHVWEANASSTPPSYPVGLQTGYPVETPTPTVIGNWWYHQVTEEIRNAVVAAGLTPDPTNLNQLTAAINQLALNSVNAFQSLSLYDMTASRSLGTYYPNNTGKMIYVMMFATAGAGYSGVTGYLNYNEVYFDAAQFNGAGAFGGIILPVPNTFVYAANLSSIGQFQWWELR